MGFRAQAGHLHLAQLLSDLMVLCSNAVDRPCGWPPLTWKSASFPSPGGLFLVYLLLVYCFGSFYSQLR